jgi:very-short-patch-repair endonuclease
MLLENRKYLDAKQVAQLSHAVARLHYAREDFWSLVIAHIPTILQDEKQSGYLYSSLLQLRFAQPSLHSRLMSLPDMQACYPSISAGWKQQRAKDLTLSKESFQTKQVEAFLTAHNIKYQAEYFDEYYIDVAVPELKLALEVCGTMHYIMPMKVLNGKTLAKKYVLEQLGWQVIIIPFFHQGGEGRFEQVLNDTLGPILPPSS